MSERDAILARVLELLSGKEQAGRPLTPESRIVADTTLDSVSVMDLVLELEDEFDISIPLNRIAEIQTVAELADAVAALRDAGTGGDTSQ